MVLYPIEGEVTINRLIGEMRVVERGRADHSLKGTQAIPGLVH